MISFLKLIRWKNISLLVISQIFISEFIFEKPICHVPSEVYLLLFITFCFAGAGNIINDFIDFKVDRINRPKNVLVPRIVSKKRTLIYYNLLNGLGIISTLILGIITQNFLLAFLLLLVCVSLYFYSKTLKGLPLIGNITIAILTSTSILFLLFFVDELDPYHKKWIWILSVFSFLLNLSREMIKDIIDIRGDNAVGHLTLPIILGKKRTKKIILFITALTLISALIMISGSHKAAIRIYYLAGVFAPLVYLYTRILKAKKQRHYKRISQFIKLIIALGIGSLFIL